jgi:hypothetical protein
MSRFSKICLLVVALSLATIALCTVVRSHPVRAANHYKYLVVSTSNQPPEGWIQDELNKRATEGWELVAPVARDAGITLIFRQEAR